MRVVARQFVLANRNWSIVLVSSILAAPLAVPRHMSFLRVTSLMSIVCVASFVALVAVILPATTDPADDFHVLELKINVRGSLVVWCAGRRLADGFLLVGCVVVCFGGGSGGAIRVPPYIWACIHVPHHRVPYLLRAGASNGATDEEVGALACHGGLATTLTTPQGCAVVDDAVLAAVRHSRGGRLHAVWCQH